MSHVIFDSMESDLTAWRAVIAYDSFAQTNNEKNASHGRGTYGIDDDDDSIKLMLSPNYFACRQNACAESYTALC